MTLNVLYCSNDLYAPFAGVSIYSLLESNRDIEHINVYYVGENITPQNQQRLFDTVADFGEGRELVFIDAHDTIERMKKMPIPQYRGSYTTNLRLFFEEFIKPDAETLLYLDCDTLVVGSLAELLQLDFEGKPCAVVQESITGNYREYIGFTEQEPYFNAGVLFINVPVWKEQGCTAELFRRMEDPANRRMNADQDYLNTMLKERVVYVSPAYNLQPFHLAYPWKTYQKHYANPTYYSKEEVDAALAKPVVYHAYRFCGQFPWHEKSVHPLTKLWLEKKMAGRFADLPPLANNGTLFKVERLLYRTMPKGMFLTVFEIMQKRSFQKGNEKIKQETK